MTLPVLILCGGTGTRMLPLTHHTPKPLQIVGDAPLLRHLMNVFAIQGYRTFILATGYLGDRVVRFADDLPSEWRVNVINSGEAASPAERIRACLSIFDGPCVLAYGDGLANIDLSALLATHAEHGRLATVTAVPMQSKFGVVQVGSANRALSFRQKPTFTDLWVNVGFMVLERPALERRFAAVEDDLLPDLTFEQQLTVYRHNGYWRPVDTVDDLAAANADATSGGKPWLKINAY